MKVKLDDGAYAPTRAHGTDAGYDLRSPCCADVPAHGSVTIETGVHVELPVVEILGFKMYTAGLIVSKSGLNVKHGITSTGLIDAGYTGSIAVKLYNNTDKPYTIERGDKISQLMITAAFTPFIDLVDSLEETDRGDNGFGSTGR